jgi:hypothetical protein
MTPTGDELVVPFPAPAAALGAATAVRSTLIASSLQSLRRRDLFARYQALLAPEHKDAVLSSVAGLWLPMDVGRAHYDACDRLGLSMLEQVEIGGDVSIKIHDTFLGVVIRTAKHAGVTPWVLLARGNQMYSRLFDGGGGIRVVKSAAKEARADVAGLPLLAIPYFRHAIRGLYQAAVGLFCTRAYVQEIVREGTESQVALKVSWA